MVAYHVVVRPAARRALKKIDPQYQARIKAAIFLLAQNPRPPGAKVLV
jgi:mRNA interferase RelE/StbE